MLSAGSSVAPVQEEGKTVDTAEPTFSWVEFCVTVSFFLLWMVMAMFFTPPAPVVVVEPLPVVKNTGWTLDSCIDWVDGGEGAINLAKLVTRENVKATFAAGFLALFMWAQG
jgi:hypothetical protein